MREICVECHAGYRADERPIRFFLGENPLEISEIEDRWYSPGQDYFRVRASDGNLYVLCRHHGQDLWTLEAYRSTESHSG